MLILLQQYRLLNTYEVPLRATHTVFHYTTRFYKYAPSALGFKRSNTDQVFDAVGIYKGIKSITIDVYHDIALFKMRAHLESLVNKKVLPEQEALQNIMMLAAIKL